MLSKGLCHGGNDLVGIIRVHCASPIKLGDSLLPDVPEPSKHLVQVQTAAIWLAHPDHDRRMLGHLPEALLGFAQFLLGRLPSQIGCEPFDAEPYLSGNRDGEVDLMVREGVRLCVVGHELSDDHALGNQGNEPEGNYPLGLDRVLDAIGLIRIVDVGNEDRPRIGVSWFPWRMSAKRGAVVIRQSPPGRELHYPRGVKIKVSRRGGTEASS